MSETTSPSSPAPRSGDLVVQAGFNWAPLFMLVAPFIDGGIEALRTHLHYTVLDSNYAEVVKGAVLAYGPAVLAWRRMQRIHATTSPPPTAPTPSLADLSRLLAEREVPRGPA